MTKPAGPVAEIMKQGAKLRRAEAAVVTALTSTQAAAGRARKKRRGTPAGQDGDSAAAAAAATDRTAAAATRAARAQHRAGTTAAATEEETCSTRRAAEADLAIDRQNRQRTADRTGAAADASAAGSPAPAHGTTPAISPAAAAVEAAAAAPEVPTAPPMPAAAPMLQPPATAAEGSLAVTHPPVMEPPVLASSQREALGQPAAGSTPAMAAVFPAVHGLPTTMPCVWATQLQQQPEQPATLATAIQLPPFNSPTAASNALWRLLEAAGADELLLRLQAVKRQAQTLQGEDAEDFEGEYSLVQRLAERGDRQGALKAVAALLDGLGG